MPRYDYRCKSCQKITEAWRGINDINPVSCGFCGCATDKLVSAVPAHKKGDGWCLTSEEEKARIKK